MAILVMPQHKIMVAVRLIRLHRLGKFGQLLALHTLAVVVELVLHLIQVAAAKAVLVV
jgi:hypothetical protein